MSFVGNERMQHSILQENVIDLDYVVQNMDYEIINQLNQELPHVCFEYFGLRTSHSSCQKKN